MYLWYDGRWIRSSTKKIVWKSHLKVVINDSALHGGWKSQEKSHSTLRGTFTFWVDSLQSNSVTRHVNFDKKIMEKFKCDILSVFQTQWKIIEIKLWFDFVPESTFDLSGNTVWPHASAFQKNRQNDHFLNF